MPVCGVRSIKNNSLTSSSFLSVAQVIRNPVVLIWVGGLGESWSDWCQRWDGPVFEREFTHFRGSSGPDDDDFNRA